MFVYPLVKKTFLSFIFVVLAATMSFAVEVEIYIEDATFKAWTDYEECRELSGRKCIAILDSCGGYDINLSKVAAGVILNMLKDGYEAEVSFEVYENGKDVSYFCEL